ncbi:MAG: thioredoxin family protein [Verrucomicrobia bacterium]|nr:MAG: thioredoxin family protein [Verrucomicrobiota bacterium]
MKKQMSILAVLFISALLAVAEVEIGKPAPDFTAKDIHGQTHKLNDYKGKIVVLEAHNLDCPFCANHYRTGAMPELQEWATSKGVVWLLVNSVNPRSPSHRSPEAAKKETEKYKIKATAWLDDSPGKVGKLYGMKTTPHMMVINKEGMLAYNGAIDDKAEDSGDPRKARNYVREAIGKLLTGETIKVTRTRPYGCGVKYAD